MRGAPIPTLWLKNKENTTNNDDNDDDNTNIIR